MFTLQRASFRQLLVLAFLLVAGLLAAASLRGLVTLEHLMLQSREAADRAAQQGAAAQTVAERSVSMERAGRQFLVLDDASLRDRFDVAAREAIEALATLPQSALQPDETPPDQPPPIAALVQSWRDRLQDITEQLNGPRSTAREREQTLATSFRELDALNAAIAERLRRDTQARNQALSADIEAGRLQLGRQMLGAIGVAVVLALGFGVWLARPLKRLEVAIVGLGENRLDQPVAILGPVDVRRLGRRLDDLRLRLSELDADKARFLRHVSHELKTPLAALREGVSLLEDGVAGPLSDTQREVARILRHNTGVLQRQIEDLLHFNAAAFEARRLTRRRTDLGALIESLGVQQQLQWQAHGLTLKVQGGPLWAEVDPDKLGVALGNLLSNAIRFSPPGGTIVWTLRPLSEGGACIEIVDDGPGVAPADRDRVFEPFYRGERQPVDALRGSGIGLSIVHEYIAAHGGRIELLPDGPGAHFRIELPHARLD